MDYSKKDFKPIIIYFSIMFGLAVIIGVVSAILNIDFNKISEIETYVVGFIILLVFLIIYGKRLISDFKKLNKKDFIITIVGFVILFSGNLLLSALMEKLGIESGNQNTIIEMLEHNKALLCIYIVLIAPITEELVFRYSFRTIFKNDIVFIIASSFTFGIMHSTGLALFVYVFIGAILALIMHKTKNNVGSSIIAHALNNLGSFITMII